MTALRTDGLHSFFRGAAVLLAVLIGCLAIVALSPMTVLSRLFNVADQYYALKFELHFWQYLFSFLAVIILSRGHLWIYGINSRNLAVSMQWLAWLYGAMILLVIATELAGIPLLPREYLQPGMKTQLPLLAMLVYWMSSPVANQILFFSLVQTVLLKQWGDQFRIGRFPVAVIVASVLFTYGATTSAFAAGQWTALITFALGLFCGMVYYRTGSLITPMLAHAFVFGFPYFLHLLRSGAWS